LPDTGDGLLGFIARCDEIDARLQSRVQRGGFCGWLGRSGGLEIDPLVNAPLEIGR